ncbi:MAG: sugar phosphate nucleotidyltransferase [Desulfobulbaceae bacterium]|nr:sugar phosphate nucleotidyltransferase [Desulfobulbaceae bacterium]HIJ90535.1 NTP transferase domain-containing protein [Deltaproteobacteria bacterium]
MKAMVLAAGLGTRLHPYSLKRPKPLFPVLDTPLLTHTISQLRQSGVEGIVVNAHHLREQIGGMLQGQGDVYVQMEDIELGTGGGLRLAQNHFAEAPFLAVNGDIVHDLDLVAAYSAHCVTAADVTMVLHDCPRFNNVRVNNEGRIMGFSGAAGAGERLLAFTGVQVINPTVLSLIPEGVFYNIIDCYVSLLKSGGNIQSLVVSDHFWTDMGTPADYLRLHEDLLLKGRLPGFFAEDGGNPFYLAKDAVLGGGVSLQDWVAIGHGATIGEGASLSRVVVWDGARVAPGSIVTDTIIMGGD